MAATFRSHIINSRDADNIVNHTPVRVLGSCSFMYMRQGDVYILGVTKTNANVMMGFRFMTNVSLSLQACPTAMCTPGWMHVMKFSCCCCWTASQKPAQCQLWLVSLAFQVGKYVRGRTTDHRALHLTLPGL